MTVAIYCRVSTDHQDCDHQLRELRQHCTIRGWAAVEYIDRGISGSKESRPALNQLLADMRAGKFQGILVWAWDRLARSVKQLVNIFEECRKRDVAIISVSQNIDTSGMYGRLVFHILAAVAEIEREIICDRVRSGLKAAKARGVILGHKTAYDRVKILGLRSQGHSIRAISRQLNVPRSSVARAVENKGI